MIIECDTCSARGRGCGQCVVAELLGAPDTGGTEPLRSEAARPEPIAWEPTERELSEWDLDAAERQALHVLASAGLIASDRPGPRRKAERAS